LKLFIETDLEGQNNGRQNNSNAKRKYPVQHPDFHYSPVYYSANKTMIRSIVKVCIQERLIVILVAVHTPAFNPMGQPEQARHHV
jgi:hypothetical protein